jgi:hypothetical protein
MTIRFLAAYCFNQFVSRRGFVRFLTVSGKIAAARCPPKWRDSGHFNTLNPKRKRFLLDYLDFPNSPYRVQQTVSNRLSHRRNEIGLGEGILSPAATSKTWCLQVEMLGKSGSND